MPTRSISIPDPNMRIDFGEYLEDQGFMQSALHVWASDLLNAICYCLRFNESNNCFEPYGCTLSLNGLITDLSIKLPPAIPLEQLILRSADSDEWPLLAEWLPTDSSLHPLELVNSTWHVEARIESNGVYVGYFKAAIPDTSARRDDRYPIHAFQRTSRFVNQTLTAYRKRDAIVDPGFVRDVNRTLSLANEDIQLGRRLKALQRLGSLITFHKGASLNRVAFFQKEDLGCRCTYAHGGDCSQNFAMRIQAKLAREFRTIAELQESIGSGELPLDDPLFAAVSGGNFETIDGKGRSLLDLMVCNNGAMEALPNETETLELLPEVHSATTVELDNPLRLAVLLRSSDSWLHSQASGELGRILLRNLNGTFVILPWKSDTRLLGLVVADLGYWAQVDVHRDLLPRVAKLSWLLEKFAAIFSTDYGESG